MQHLSMPIKLASSGKLATVVADSAADIAQSLGVLLATRPGERLSVPDYGTPSPLYEGADLDQITSAIDFWEPRAADVQVELSGEPDSPTITIAAEEG